MARVLDRDKLHVCGLRRSWYVCVCVCVGEDEEEGDMISIFYKIINVENSSFLHRVLAVGN